MTERQRQALEGLVRSTTAGAGRARRARAILLLSEGESLRQIRLLTGMGLRHITKWRDRFAADGLEGLADRPRSGRPRKITLEKQVAIIADTQGPPPEALTHWSTRQMARRHRVSHSTVHRLWQAVGLKPHRQKSYKASPDPQFFQKALDVIGLYLNPPERSVVFCVDEKSAIQALNRLQPLLPLRCGNIERRGFEYERTGTCSLYAALEVATGKVIGQCSPRHRSVDLLRFLQTVVRGRRRKPLHLIMDNLSAHKTAPVQQWLDVHPNVHIHYTPTYASWLNQVEIWFSLITTQCIRRGSFRSVSELKRKIIKYIRRYNDRSVPFVWTYTDPRRRIRVSPISQTRH